MIKSFTGPMFCDKSAYLIEIYKRIWNKSIVAAFKPKVNTRDGNAIKSRKYPNFEIPSLYVDTVEDIQKIVLENGYKTVLIDEAEFLTGDASVLVDMSVMLGVDFYIAGLNMTSEQVPFGLMPAILSVSDEITIIRGFCEDCNKPSVYSYSLNTEKKDEILVGDNYISLCHECLKKRVLEKKQKTLGRIK